MLRSMNSYIVLKRRITVEGNNDDEARNKKLILKKKMLYLDHAYRKNQ